MQTIQNVPVQPTPQTPITVEDMIKMLWEDKYGQKKKRNGPRKPTKNIVDIAMENEEFKKAVLDRFNEDASKSIKYNIDLGNGSSKFYLFEGESPKIKTTANGDIVYQKQASRNGTGTKELRKGSDGQPIPEFIPCTQKTVAKEILSIYGSQDPVSDKGKLYVEWLRRTDELNRAPKPQTQMIDSVLPQQPAVAQPVVAQPVVAQPVLGATPMTGARPSMFGKRGRGGKQ